MPEKNRSGAVITNKGYVLLVHQTQSKKWGIPKGRIEENETPVQTIVREIKEEIGYDLDPQIVEQAVKESKSKFPLIDLNKEWDDVKITIDHKEISEYKWLDMKDLDEFVKNHDINGFSKTALNRVYFYKPKIRKRNKKDKKIQTVVKSFPVLPIQPVQKVELSDDSVDKIVDKLLEKLDDVMIDRLIVRLKERSEKIEVIENYKFD